MSALPVTDHENISLREDVLRELNLYPLWQSRVQPNETTLAEEAAAEMTIAAPVAERQKAARADAGKTVVADVSSLGWVELKKSVKSCNACSLRAACTQTVFGMGDEKADWLFVGSWPTEDDDKEGTPFAGLAGQLLDNMLAAIKLKRGDNVYLSSVVKCTGSIKRGPSADQIALCSSYLARQIQLIQPKMIVVLGHAAATALLGEDREWNSIAGKLHSYCGREKDNPHAAIPLMITHHPAALLLTPLNKAQTWRDLCLARDTMQRLVAAQ